MRILVTGIAMFALCVSAHAHRLNLFATASNGVISGKAYFSDGKPARGVAVQAYDPGGAALGETTTDEEGRFEYALPVTGGAVTLKSISGDGHAAEFTVTPADPAGSAAAADTPAASGPSPGGASAGTIERAVDEAVARQIRPLREQLDAFEHEVRFRDAIGGVGYIVGAVGLVALLKARRGHGRP